MSAITQSNKKRGRKPNLLKTKSSDEFKQVQNESNQSVKIDAQLNISTINPPLILHLNHLSSTNDNNENSFEQSKSFESTFYNYNPIMQEPIAYEDNTPLSSLPESYKEDNKVKNTTNTTTIKQMFDNNPNNIDSDDASDERKQLYVNKSNAILLKDMVFNKEWCDQTNYYCYWDCQPFDHSPFGIPIKYRNNKFYVYGCFCSLECATAYNFYDNEKNDTCWENYNLINLLSNKINYKRCVNPAISRKCLNIFGGPLDINAFREENLQNKHYNVLTYPMVSLMEQVEEINETIPYHKNFIPLDKSRIEKIEEANKEIILSKRKSNLEETMKLKFID